MKRFLSIFIIVIGVIFSANVALADDIVDVYINGEKLVTDQTAIIYQDRTMVPLRAICESLNCDVDWDAETSTALIENEVTMVAVQINNYNLTKKDRRINDGEQRYIPIDVPPIIYNDRTLVPARAIAEAINAQVEWDGKRNRVDIVLEYDFIDDYSDGIALVGKDGKRGFIDKKGEIVIPLIYDLAYPCKEGLAHVAVRGNDGYYKVGFVDKSGKVIIPLEYSSASWWFVDGTVSVSKGMNKYIIDKNGKVIIDLSSKYDGVNPFSEGLAWVSKDHKDGYINQKGEEIIPLIYDYAWGDTRDIRREFKNGVVPVRLSGKHGYIDRNGDEVIPIIHDASGAMSEDVVCMKLDGKWAYYDIWGNQLTDFIFDDAEDFEDGQALVLFDGDYYVIDKDYLYNN